MPDKILASVTHSDKTMPADITIFVSTERSVHTEVSSYKPRQLSTSHINVRSGISSNAKTRNKVNLHFGNVSPTTLPERIITYTDKS